MQHTPVAPGRRPLIGHSLGFGFKPLEFLDEQRATGAMTALRIGPWRARIVNDPELVREMLVSRVKDFLKEGPLYELSAAFVGNGLAISEGTHHRRQRRLIQPAFTRGRMPGYHSVMREAAEEMTGRWHEGERLNIWNDLFHLAVSVIGNMLSPGHFPREKTERIVWAVSTASAGIGWRSVTPVPWLHRLPTPEHRRFTQAQKMLHEFADEAVEAHRTRDDAPAEHFLTLLLEARDEQGEPLSAKELRDEVVTLFSAGSATVATSLAWALHLLSCDEKADERAHQEIQDVLKGEPVTSADLPRLEYLGRVITEVLRLYPPAWLLPRITHVPTELGGHTIPAGAQVFFSPYSIHRDPSLYSNPDTFDPDRWLPENNSRSRSTYVPFGAGVHQCIGNNFALTESLIALATILPSWRLDPVPDVQVRVRPRALLEPDGLILTARDRTKEKK
ncbi:cytochrome P450 [Streptomyces kanamyceticus]|uniref:Cytochrome P450 n=1 Tax=Streptomyces kanamyceticus TaxID=1967 RepID=A0A5J6GNT4_STRKN|nr:cytochrome P450 [Streptomyces kanamyceticus]QEU96937.1 cytochrome P450 [Streptomyces kanamyceticus]